MTGRLRLAVLVSGRGSNLQSLIDAQADPKYPAEIVLVLSNVADAFALERARQAKIATAVFQHRNYPDRTSFDADMTRAIEDADASLVCLAGFMRLLSDEFVARWKNRLINIHPSLLPAYKGLHVHERVVADGARFSGCTVHFVRPAMDEGPIIAQAAVPVHPGDTADALAARVLAEEHRIYPLAVRLIAEGRVKVDGERASIDGWVPPKGTLINPMP